MAIRKRTLHFERVLIDAESMDELLAAASDVYRELEARGGKVMDVNVSPPITGDDFMGYVMWRAETDAEVDAASS